MLLGLVGNMEEDIFFESELLGKSKKFGNICAEEFGVSVAVGGIVPAEDLLLLAVNLCVDIYCAGRSPLGKEVAVLYPLDST